MDFKGTFLRLFYFVMFPFTCISYCLIPTTPDVNMFLGTERIADIYYPFPQGIDLAWEIKFISNRVINWVLYKAGSSIVGFDNQWFPFVVKLIALAVVVAVSYYLSTKLKGWYVFPLVFIALTWTSPRNILQAEYWAVILALVCIGLLLDDRWYHPLLAGILFVGISLLKGVTGLMLVSVLCAVYLLKGVKVSERFWELCTGIAIGVSAFLILSVTVWTHMIPDMLMSAQVANVGFYPISYILLMFIVWTAFYLPSTPLAFIALFVALFLMMRLRGWNLVAFVLMWGAPFAMAIIQGEFMIYHYYPTTIPALVSLVMWERGR
jgi:hypothetical protein